MASADLDDLSQFTSYSGITTTTTISARTGTKTFRLVSGTCELSLPSVLSSVSYTRFAIFWDLNSSGIQLDYRSGATVLSRIILYPSGSFRINSGTSTQRYQTNWSDLQPHIWNVFEFKYTPGSSTGSVEVKRNGVLMESVSNLNLSTSNDYTNIQLQCFGSGYRYIDDILIDDASWPGLGGIEVIRPSGDGTDQQWDSGNYEDVNVDNDATYVATDAEVAAKQSFTIPALAADRKTPKAVGLFTKSQLSGAGSGTLRPYLDANQGQSLALSTSLQYTKDFQAAYPTEVGLEVVV